MVQAEQRSGSMCLGQDIVVANYIALEGTLAVIENKESELLKWFSAGYIKEIKELKSHLLISEKLIHWEKLGATEAEPIDEGGIMTSLWNLAAAYEVGIKVKLKNIPIKQATIEICERFDLNPYRLKSGSCLLLVANNGMDLVENLNEIGVFSTVIGKVTKGIKRTIINGDNLSFLNRPKNDEIHKILSENIHPFP